MRTIGRRRPKLPGPLIMGGATSFSPQRVPNLVLWLKSDTGITLNGSNVSAWADQSGQGHDLAQGTAAQQPAYVANQVAGKSVIRFHTDGKQLSFSTPWSQSTSSTFYAVVHNQSSTGWRLLMNRDTSGGAPFGPALYVSTDAADGRPSLHWGNAVLLTHTTALAAEWTIVTWRFSPSAAEIAIENGAFEDASPIDTIVTTWTSIGLATAHQWGGDLAEIVGYHRVVSTAEHNSVLAYLKSRYAISYA